MTDKPGRQPPKTRMIPSTMTTVDMRTGRETVKPMAWGLMPPPAHCCQTCAREHDPLDPHDAQSFYYKLAFATFNKRAVTWADALAHCELGHAANWKAALTTMGQWSEPPEGVAPIKHLGENT